MDAHTVVPAKAGIQYDEFGMKGDTARSRLAAMDPGFRRGDEQAA
jgi:hypothetical protein